MPTDLPALSAASIPEDSRLAVARQIVQIFALERYVYLSLSVVAAGMVLLFGYHLITKPDVSVNEVASLFGSGGIIAFNISRLLFMFNRVIEVVFISSQPPSGATRGD